MNLKQIAEKLGVSVSTVSRVVNNLPNVNEKTRARVLSELKKSAYVPNNIAKSLKTSSSKIIGILIPDITEAYFTRVIKGIDRVLSENGYMMFLCDFHESKQEESRYIKTLIESRADGVIVATLGNNIDYSEELNSYGMPAVFFDNLPSLKKGSYSSVTLDNIAAGELAARELIKSGHKKLAVITGKPEESTAADRLSGFLRECKKSGIDVNKDCIIYGDFKWESGYNGAKKILEKHPEVTALFTASAMMTRGAYVAAKESGRDIPREFEIMGFDIKDSARLMVPKPKSVLQPEEQMGERAASLLLDKIKGGGNKNLVMKPTLSDSAKHW